MTFKKFVRKGVKEVTEVPRIERQGSLVADAGSSGVQNDDPEVSSAVDPPILNIDMSEVEITGVSVAKKKKKKKKREVPIPQSIAGRVKKRKVWDDLKESKFRRPSAPKTDLHDQKILTWLNGEDMNAENIKKIDNMDNETFLRVFKKDRQFHTYPDALIARRFSRMSIHLRSKSFEVQSVKIINMVFNYKFLYWKGY
uniref:uncharacterized protein LOC122586291 n=1 Tax=Erigeron canadensis TaxID=72917 RepID=UPI001CB98AC1|nr:uncharacterized protein LOC122586291 [Erigeron canadensis]